jgi:hypothetical protein
MSQSDMKLLMLSLLHEPNQRSIVFQSHGMALAADKAGMVAKTAPVSRQVVEDVNDVAFHDESQEDEIDDDTLKLFEVPCV